MITVVLLGFIFRGESCIFQYQENKTTEIKQQRPVLCENVSGITFSPNGKDLIILDEDGFISSWSMQQKTVRKSRPEDRVLFGQHSSIFYDENANAIVVVDPYRGLTFFDSVNHVKLKMTKWPDKKIFSVVPNLKTGVFSLVALGDNKAKEGGFFIHVWNYREDKTVSMIKQLPWDDTVQFFEKTVLRTAFCPEGNKLVFADFGKTVSVWSVSPAKKSLELTGHLSCVRSVLWSPDSRYIYSYAYQRDSRGNSKEDLIRIWNAETGKQLIQFSGNQVGNGFATFSPDGKILCTIRRGKEICLWELLTGQVLLRYSFEEATVNIVAFSPDGKYLAVGTNKGAFLVTPTKPENWSPPKKASDSKEFERLWVELGHLDSSVAYKAMLTMCSWPKETVAFLEKRINPFSNDLLNQYFKGLNSEKFNERVEAHSQLEKNVLQVAPALYRLMDESKSQEVQSRVRTILKKDYSWPLRDPSMLRCLRGIWVLQSINNLQSVEVLTKIASGAPLARQTQEAQAALRCLANLPNPVFLPNKHK